MLQRALSPFREFGFGPGLLYLIDRLLGRLSPSLRLIGYELMVQPVATTAVAARATVDVREIERTDTATLSRMPVPEGVVQARFAQQAICLGAFRKGELVGYMWFCPGGYDEDEVRVSYALDPPAASAFDYDFFLFPEHRMGRAFAGLWDGANRAMQARGVQQTFSRITEHNVSSRRAHRRLGGRPIGHALFLQAWRLEVMLATVPQYLHVSFGPRDRARLRLRTPA